MRTLTRTISARAVISLCDRNNVTRITQRPSTNRAEREILFAVATKPEHVVGQRAAIKTSLLSRIVIVAALSAVRYRVVLMSRQLSTDETFSG